MKKFLLIPTTIVTVLLAVAFVSPATASGAVRAVAPQLHFVGFSSAPAPTTGQQASVTSAQDGPSRGSASSPVVSAGPQFADQAPPPVDSHSVATPSTENCGRFGNGYHGGKHLFVCPNRPFPPPPSH